MALTAVHAQTSQAAAATIDWDAVQFAQFEHDEKYHREISRLTVQERLKHMALHFAKYAGRLHEEYDDAAFRKALVDTLIIGISCCNILNVRLGQHFPGGGNIKGREKFVRLLTIAAGRMAAACEKMDHLEDFPFRRIAQENVLAIVSASLQAFSEEGCDPISEMQKRLLPIKEKSIFYGQR